MDTIPFLVEDSWASLRSGTWWAMIVVLLLVAHLVAETILKTWVSVAKAKMREPGKEISAKWIPYQAQPLHAWLKWTRPAAIVLAILALGAWFAMRTGMATNVLKGNKPSLATSPNTAVEYKVAKVNFLTGWIGLEEIHATKPEGRDASYDLNVKSIELCASPVDLLADRGRFRLLRVSGISGTYDDGSKPNEKPTVSQKEIALAIQNFRPMRVARVEIRDVDVVMTNHSAVIKPAAIDEMPKPVKFRIKTKELDLIDMRTQWQLIDMLTRIQGQMEIDDSTVKLTSQVTGDAATATWDYKNFPAAAAGAGGRAHGLPERRQISVTATHTLPTDPASKVKSSYHIVLSDLKTYPPPAKEEGKKSAMKLKDQLHRMVDAFVRGHPAPLTVDFDVEVPMTRLDRALTFRKAALDKDFAAAMEKAVQATVSKELRNYNEQHVPTADTLPAQTP